MLSLGGVAWGWGVTYVVSNVSVTLEMVLSSTVQLGRFYPHWLMRVMARNYNLGLVNLTVHAVPNMCCFSLLKNTQWLPLPD